MNEVLKLWNTRRQEYWITAVKYLRLIGNSGFLFTIYLLFLFGSYYYGRFLEWLPETFPAVSFFTIIFAWMAARGRVRTFTKQADLVFLLPMEKRMKPYFRSSFRYSWFMESVWLTLALLVLAPLFTDRIAFGGEPFFIVLASLLLLKGWNLAASFEEQRIQGENLYRVHKWGRFLINGSVLYILFSTLSIPATAAAGVVLLLLHVLYFSRIQGTLQWQRLIEIESNTVRTFYRVANNFTDVPHLKESIKERKWIAWVTNGVSYGQRNVYKYLFGRAFFRSGDYFGIFVRLTLIGMLFLYAVDLVWGMWLMAALFSYMTVLQMETLGNHFRLSQMPDLYPVGKRTLTAGLQYWLVLLGSVQTVLFAGITAGNMTAALPVLVITGGIYAYVIFFRVPAKYETE
ncbi:ABC transporter permease [Alkalicoccus halolimnae]|uniref:ABC transporter permease n=1 Tax=Alkalicoccus halolimnae TaxID=1667239 RepID=A0A5C7F745_9BACI|nr:ABC transporter permease [Alkalicoccus halolimnae]TXF86531.1 ABC transporter permease [Alkalicoccus halolimnae]